MSSNEAVQEGAAAGATMTEEDVKRIQAEAAGQAKSGAKILLANGEPRLDYIRKRWKEGISRGQILKEVNALKTANSEDATYQIIFAATKGQEGGPPGADKDKGEEHSGQAVDEAA